MIMKQMDIMVQEDIAGPIKEACQSCYDKCKYQFLLMIEQLDFIYCIEQ